MNKILNLTLYIGPRQQKSICLIMYFCVQAIYWIEKDVCIYVNVRYKRPSTCEEFTCLFMQKRRNPVVDEKEKGYQIFEFLL